MKLDLYSTVIVIDNKLDALACSEVGSLQESYVLCVLMWPAVVTC